MQDKDIYTISIYIISTECKSRQCQCRSKSYSKWPFLFVEFLKCQTNRPMVVYSHQLIVTKKLYLFMCSLLQVCKFRVGSFNYPMNKMVFYNELIPEDTIIKSILDYKWVHNPIVGPASRSGRVQEASHFINNIACNIENKRHKKFYPIFCNSVC